ncbi:MAG: hypothetical protein ACJASR_001342 [Psychroserpens sp.]|jgi:hypothetical protein
MTKYDKIIRKLSFLLAFSNKAYKEYLNNDKQFLYAKIIFNVNKEIKNLLKNGLLYLPVENHNDVIDIIFHIDVWANIWLEENKKQKPTCNDRFSFENKISFPKDSVKNIISLYNRPHANINQKTEDRPEKVPRRQ